MKRRLIPLCLLLIPSLVGCEPQISTLTFSRGLITLQEDSNYQIAFEEKINIKKIQFVFDDDNIASIDEDGLISGLNRGTTTLTATYRTLSDSCQIKVTANPERPDYSRAYGDYSISVESEEIGNYNLSAPIEYTYNSKNNTLFVKDVRIDSITSYFDDSLSPEQIKDNIETLSLIHNPIDTLNDKDFNYESEQSNDDGHQFFAEKMFNLYLQSKDLTGEELVAFVDNLDNELGYSYISNDYQSFGYISNDSADYYIYRNDNSDTVNQLFSSLVTISPVLDLIPASTINNITAHEIVEILIESGLDVESFGGEEELENRISDLMETFNFTKTENLLGISYDLSLSESFIQSINEEIQNNFTDMSQEVKELVELKELSISIKKTRKDLTSYTIKEIDINAKTKMLNANIKQIINSVETIPPVNAFRYYDMHHAFEQ